MTTSRVSQREADCCVQRNLVVGLIIVAAVGILCANFEPRPTAAIQSETTVTLPTMASQTDVADAEAVAEAHVTSASNRPVLGQPANRRAQSGDLQQDAPDVVTGREALLRCLSVLQMGYEKLRSIPDYTATFTKRERIDGELCNEEVMHLKLRHEPLSVYLKWLRGEPGREALYVDGRHGGKLLLRAGGLTGRLLPPLKLDPNSSTSMGYSRHPITRIGIRELARSLIQRRRGDLQRPEGLACRMTEKQQFDGRDCYVFDVEYESPQNSEAYRKSVFYIDSESSLPIEIKNYTWPDPAMDAKQPALDRSTLVEHYRYSDLNLHAELTDHDFDRSNDNYQFRAAVSLDRGN